MIIGKNFTNRESQSIDRYLQEIAKIELIDATEEIDLAIKIRTGSAGEKKKALDKLTNSNLRFVVSVAKQYQNQGLSLGDLINEGNLGLIKAAQRFDETRGFKFISYAVWWIRQSILQALADQSRIVRLPLNRVGAIKKIGKAYNELEQKNERKPSVDELADEVDMSLLDVHEALKMSGRHLSMDAPLVNGEDSKMSDVMPDVNQAAPDERYKMESLQFDMGRALNKLDERERKIIELYFGFGTGKAHTLEEIGDKYELTRERVRQVKEKAIRKLKHNSETNNLKSYLG
ncbi:MAG: RNA polymerase sigma factor RpoD/SigA [Ignavibacteria bacterium]|jgi:RNA polymerase primary sigma factor